MTALLPILHGERGSGKPAPRDAIELPWPPKELNPNARIHHLAKARHAKVYREAAYWLTEWSKAKAPADGRIMLKVSFRPPDKRRRDLDNMLSSIKAGLDGIADALGVNDQRFDLSLSRCEPVPGGKIIVTLEAA